MVKKGLLIALCLCLMISLAACAGNAADSTGGVVDEFVKPENYATVLLVSINPQVRLYIDRDGIVLAVEPVNDDAKQFVDDIAYENVHYQAVITEFISAANDNGFVKDDAKIEFEIVEVAEDIDEDDVLDQASTAAEHTVEDLHLPMEVNVVRHPHHHGKGDHESEPTEPHEHSYAPATCEEPATCACGATQGEPLGHTWVDATCTEPKTCSVCKAVDGEALGHRFTDATCTAAKVCTVCGTEEGTALGHQFTNATCTAPKTCTVCGAVEGNALDHNYSGGICASCGAVDPTYKELSPGVWQCLSLKDGVLYNFRIFYRFESITWLTVWFGSDIDTLDEEFRNSLLETPENLTEYQGKYYYLGAGDGIECGDSFNGDTATLSPFYDQIYGDIVIQRIAGNQFVVVSASGLEKCFNQTIADALPAGSVFVWISD